MPFPNLFGIFGRHPQAGNDDGPLTGGIALTWSPDPPKGSGHPVFATGDVIGAADWSPVQHHESKPWCAICMLESRFERGGNTKGTGWLVGPRTVITAAHNLWMPESGRAIEIGVTPAVWYRQGSTPFRTLKTSQYVYDSRWRNTILDNKRVFFDYGAIFLPRPGFTDVPYYLSYRVLDPQFWNMTILNCAGYPQKLGFDFVCASGKACSETPGGPFFIGDGQEMVIHDIDTGQGESGGPIFWTSADQSDYKVIAIHTQGIGLARGFNAGVRITGSVKAMIDKWRDNPDAPGIGPVTVPPVA